MTRSLPSLSFSCRSVSLLFLSPLRSLLSLPLPSPPSRSQRRKHASEPERGSRVCCLRGPVWVLRGHASLLEAAEGVSSEAHSGTGRQSASQTGARPQDPVAPQKVPPGPASGADPEPQPLRQVKEPVRPLRALWERGGPAFTATRGVGLRSGPGRVRSRALPWSLGFSPCPPRPPPPCFLPSFPLRRCPRPLCPPRPSSGGLSGFHHPITFPVGVIKTH